MFSRRSLVLLLALATASCGHLQKKKQEEKPAEPAMKDVNGDVSFQAFLGRLRKAVAAHDAQEIASMMTSDFGYRLQPPGEGEGVFQYWDENGTWKELDLVLSERFVPKGNYMVAPQQFALDPEYRGYRAGIGMVDGSWKFIYFVSE